MKKRLQYKSNDDLEITADLYTCESPRAVLILCHMANSSRGEYIESSKRLVSEGYHCLVPDLRSGNEINGVVNETAKRARNKGLPTSYLDAKPDVLASIENVMGYDLPVILVGSSYSASLAPLVAIEDGRLGAIAMFSPGEYLQGVKLVESIAPLDIPTFVTSARNECENAMEVIRNVDQKLVTKHCPDGSSAHGSRALWSEVDGNRGVWKAFLDFLSTI